MLGHDHVSSLIDFDGIPAVVAGAAGEQRRAKVVDYVADDGAQIKTRWLYKREPSWARLDVDTEQKQVNIGIHSKTGREIIELP